MTDRGFSTIHPPGGIPDDMLVEACGSGNEGTGEVTLIVESTGLCNVAQSIGRFLQPAAGAEKAHFHGNTQCDST